MSGPFGQKITFSSSPISILHSETPTHHSIAIRQTRKWSSGPITLNRTGPPNISDNFHSLHAAKSERHCSSNRPPILPKRCTNSKSEKLYESIRLENNRFCGSISPILGCSHGRIKKIESMDIDDAFADLEDESVHMLGIYTPKSLRGCTYYPSLPALKEDA